MDQLYPGYASVDLLKYYPHPGSTLDLNQNLGVGLCTGGSGVRPGLRTTAFVRAVYAVIRSRSQTAENCWGGGSVWRLDGNPVGQQVTW